MSEAEQIAAKLTEAQRRALNAAAGEYGADCLSWGVPWREVGHPLMNELYLTAPSRMGKRGGWRTGLTDLGLQVRAVLESRT